jgi:uncharacterized protein (DUF2062 family)
VTATVLRRTLKTFQASFTGLSPETIAMIFVLGVVLGVFPVFGLPTLLCAAAAIAFRLNLAAIQLVNQVSAPLQYALLLPLGRIGAHIMGAHVSGNVLHNLANGARCAIVGWACFCVPLGLLLYLLIYLVIALALRRHRQACFHRVENPV